MAGAVAGLASCLLLQPLDVLKTRLQESRSSDPATRRLFGIVHLTKMDGIASFWRGLAPTIIRNVPGTALYFALLSHLRKAFAGKHVDPSMANLVSGSLARVSVGFAMMPVTVLKVRLESTLYNCPKLTLIAKDIFAREGLSGFFRGFGATAFRDAPHAGIYVVFYERLRGQLSSSLLNPLFVNITSGLLAGFAATAVTHPFDLLKTRVQLDPARYPNFLRALLTVSREEGLRGFASGFATRVTRKTLGSAITWTVYEEFSRHKEA